MSIGLFLQDYRPQSQLVTPETHVSRARFPVIDAHNHLPIDHPRMADIDLDQMIREMDFVNIRTIVNLSGGTGDLLKRNVQALDAAYPGRFATFCNVDWTDVGEPGWSDAATAQLVADAKAGARGLKIFKRLGLNIKDSRGELVMPDDPRIAPLWDKAGELGIPVLIHTADPVSFFQPLDRYNERYEHLLRRPDWHFYGPDYPSFDALIASLYRLIGAHPRTDFITAHVGCYPENLGFVSKMLDEHPNLYTDISARIVELGRVPYSAREWFCKFADRILFGTDATPRIPMYQRHYRFLETDDEYFDDRDRTLALPRRWKIYGVHLPDDVLRKVYYENAARLLKLT